MVFVWVVVGDGSIVIALVWVMVGIRWLWLQCKNIGQCYRVIVDNCCRVNILVWVMVM